MQRTPQILASIPTHVWLWVERGQLILLQEGRKEKTMKIWFTRSIISWWWSSSPIGNKSSAKKKHNILSHGDWPKSALLLIKQTPNTHSTSGLYIQHSKPQTPNQPIRMSHAPSYIYYSSTPRNHKLQINLLHYTLSII